MKTLECLTQLLRSVMPPHCLQNPNGIQSMHMSSYCLACIQALLDKGRDMLEIANQAKSAGLAKYLLQFLKWDDDQTLSEGMATNTRKENYSEMKSNSNSEHIQNNQVAVRVYSVAVMKILLDGKYTHEYAEAAIINGSFESIWASYKDQSLELYVSQSERRRLLLGDEVTKFLEDMQ